MRRVLQHASPVQAGLIVLAPDDRINWVVRLFHKHLRISAAAMDMEDPIDLDENLHSPMPALRHTVCVRIGPELLRKRPDPGHPAAAADIGRPSQSPTAVSAR